MEIQMWQIVAMTLLAALIIWDGVSLAIIDNKPVLVGAIAGLIMGDLTMGLAVGATLQLMILGVGTYGGSSMPDYMTGAIIGTAFAVTSGQGVEFGIALAVPVGLLLVNMDILGRFCNIFFVKRVEAAIEREDYKAINRNMCMGLVAWGVPRALPVFLMLIFGNEIVDIIVNNIPEWLMGGLTVAGGLLPAVGIAILLRYLPVKQYMSYLLFGFVMAAYLAVPMVGIAIFGVGLAILSFQRSAEAKQVVVTNEHQISKEGLLDGEYED